MNFDVVIIGAGIAGLTCGLTLQEKGVRCAIINNGQAALDFSSGSMDLLSRLPNGSTVDSFAQSYAALAQQSPNHPYVILGKDVVLDKIQQFETLAKSLNLSLVGSSDKNHKRVTALGGLRGTWLSPNSVPTVSLEGKFPHDNIVLLGIEGYHDFQPQLLADNLKQNPQFAHCEITTNFLHIPELDHLRQNSREFRSVNIAQVLEYKLSFNNLVDEIKQAVGNAKAAFLPACFGLDDQSFFESLKQATGIELYELPTLPPSLLGIRQHRQLRHRFEKLGGVMFNGDRALRSEFEGNKVARIFTQLHLENAVTAKYFVLASGGFFSNGLVSEFEEIYEPLFRADIVKTERFNATDRFSWISKRFADPQPYQSAGVVINAECQVQKDGNNVENLFAIGAVIGGYNGIELGCGSGVAVTTALKVADNIIAKESSN